uniref:Sushi domain-containing protein n=1 Tax=Cairina moschata TaxID=8855 RepID=A0A8C3BAU8_CAIMO
MTGQRFGKCIAFCLLPWSCLSVAWSSAAGPRTALPSAGPVLKGLPRDSDNGTYVHSNISAQCTALPMPRHGHYYVDRGSGVSLGSVVVYWCEEGYQLVGSERLSCLHPESAPSWSHPEPRCEAVPQAGSRLAVAASLVSGAVIAALAAAFAVCCWRERARRSRGPGQQPRRKGGRWERGPSAAESGRRALGRLRQQHHRRDYRLPALCSAVRPGAGAGCSNPACQRSSENLPKLKLPLQSAHPTAHLLPPWAAQPPAAPHRLLLPLGPDCIDLTRGLPPGCYRSYEDHQLLHKFGRPI